MEKHFYQIYNLKKYNYLYEKTEKIPSWIRYYLYDKTTRELSEILTGSSLTLTDSVKKRFKKFIVNGASEQTQYEGYNLFNRDAKDRGWQLIKENYQNGIKLTSTNNSGVCYITYDFPFDYNETKDIYFNFLKIGNGFVNIYFRDIDNNDIKSLTNQQNPFSVTNIPATTVKVVIYIYGSTANTGDVTIYDNIQLELGTVPSPYEPYVRRNTKSKFTISTAN